MVTLAVPNPLFALQLVESSHLFAGGAEHLLQ